MLIFEALDLVYLASVIFPKDLLSTRKIPKALGKNRK